MKDPYEVLGVSRTASDNEIKTAYRELVKKYHPDNYANNPLADLASEKMKEVNEAYDSITRARSSQNTGYQGGYQSGTSQNSGSYSYGYGGGGSGNSSYAQVRSYINANQLDAAESVLNTAPTRDGEWYYLKGTIAYRRGWLDEARQHYQTACAMVPSNFEYQNALRSVQGGYTPYRQTNYQQRSDLDDACNLCNALLCLNCLCGGRRGC